MRRRHNLTPGQQFHRLTLQEYISRPEGHYWKCVCVCGKTTFQKSYALVTGHAQSCGCANDNSLAAMLKSKITHGQTRDGKFTLTYKRWVAMRRRCNDPTQENYPRYGGIGVKVCSEWNHDFTTFLRDMGPCPNNKMQIDRIDASRGYEPSNCRWVTIAEQRMNNRDIRQVTIGDETLSLIEWSRKTGIRRSLIYNRLHVLHWPVDKLFSPKKINQYR